MRTEIWRGDGATRAKCFLSRGCMGHEIFSPAEFWLRFRNPEPRTHALAERRSGPLDRRITPGYSLTSRVVSVSVQPTGVMSILSASA